MTNLVNTQAEEIDRTRRNKLHWRRHLYDDAEKASTGPHRHTTMATWSGRWPKVSLRYIDSEFRTAQCQLVYCRHGVKRYFVPIQLCVNL